MDWKKIIADLQQSGLSQKSIGEHVGRSQVWVAGVLSGRFLAPKWADGEKLIELHKRVSRQQKRRAA